MKTTFLLALFSGVLVHAAVCNGEEVFTSEAEILGLSRNDPADAIKTGLQKKELVLSEAIDALTTYRRVSRDQYLRHAHTIGVPGTVTLKGGRSFRWEIEPEYAAVVTSDEGEVVYLLHPRLQELPK